MNMTDFFVEQIHNLAKQKIKGKHIKIAKYCILDYLGVAFAGSHIAREKIVKFLDQFKAAKGNYTVIGMNKKTSLYNAVFTNAFNAHAAELDDGHRYAALHPGTPIISVLLSLLEDKRISPRDFIKGLIIGYEVAIILGRTIQPYHKQKGFHATGTCGTIGAAVAVGVAMGFSKEQLKNALSAAVTSASGILEVLDDRSELKPFNIGKASLNGLMSAFMGYAGFMGPEDILGGKRGFFSVMGDPVKPYLNGQIGIEPLMIEGIYLKPYASCRHCHPAIEAAIHLRKQYDFTCGSIASIKVKTYDLAVFGHDHSEIKGVASAKMSTPFGIAVALTYGKAGINEFNRQTIKNKKLMRLAEMVEVSAVDELSALVPEKRSAIVEIHMTSGQIYSHRVDYPKGEPENPLSDSELYEKFLDLATFGGFSVNEAKELAGFVEDFCNIKSFERFFALLS